MLAGGHGDIERGHYLGYPGVVVLGHRLFVMNDAELILEPPSQPDGSRDGEPVVGVEAQLDFVADRPADLAQHCPIVRWICVRAYRSPVHADFDHRVALFDRPGCAAGHFHGARFRAAANACVHAHTIAPSPSEKVRKTLARHFAQDVP